MCRVGKFKAAKRKDLTRRKQWSDSDLCLSDSREDDGSLESLKLKAVTQLK
jgi:hypothetical protein